MEDDLQWKTTFNRVYSILPENFDSHSSTDPDRKFYQLSKPEIEFQVVEEMYATWRMCTYVEKMTFSGNND